MGNLRAVPTWHSTRPGNAAIPTSIRIGALDYGVRHWSMAEAKRSRALGVCDPDNLTIRIRAGLPPSKEAEVLLHEVLHAAYTGAGLNKNEGPDPEERIVTGLGFQLLQVWRDNPQLVEFFEGAFRPGAVSAFAG